MSLLGRQNWMGWPVPRDLWRLPGEFQRLLETAVPTASRGEYPAVNVFAGQDRLRIVSELPGCDPSSVEVMVNGDLITLKGQRPVDAGGENVTWHRRERPAGKFCRTLKLPYEVDTQNVEAVFEKGVLSLTLHRPEHQRPRKVTIKSA